MAHPLDEVDAPTPAPASRRPRRVGMCYLRSYSFLFEREGWLADTSWMSLWLLAPFVGQVVVIGYGYEAIVAMCRHADTAAPNFSPAAVNQYVNRGASPWGFSAVFVMIGFPIFFFASYLALFIVGMAALVTFASGGSSSTALWIISVLAGLFMLGLTSAGFTVVSLLAPLALRSAMSESFLDGRVFWWTKDFIRRVWWELMLATLFWFVSSVALLAVGGALTLGIGLLHLSTLVHLSGVHLNYQLYKLYLHRGGEPIPLARVAHRDIQPTMVIS